MKRTRAFGFAPGFTLVELMVAAVLGVIVLLAVSYAYIGNRYNYLMNAELSRMQESGRAALDVIARSLENAGFAGCRAAPGDVQVTSDVDADWVSWLKMGFLVDSGGGSVTGLDGYTPQLRVFGPLEMGVVAVTGEPGSDGKIPVRTGPTLSAMAQIILPGKSIPGGPMLISDCSQAYIFNGAIDAAGGTIMAGTSGLPSGHTYTTGAQVAMLGEGAPFYLAARNLGGSSTVTNRSGTPETVMALLGGGVVISLWPMEWRRSAFASARVSEVKLRRNSSMRRTSIPTM
ncbi:MAG: prepilin-type N-terminal cleavage/methylation domain-containing protein [Zoogloeaceae bacterium]|nr:prepilin-type N-terminal cleavage/methylation domain-containing protein [Zoogloeaceae bacterium]